MGLLNYYNDSNKVVDTALQVQYACVPETYEAHGWIPDPNFPGSTVSVLTDYTAQYWVIHRYATKSYGYVGMNYNTAISCQNAKVNQYTRPFSRVTWKQQPVTNWWGDNQGTQTVLSTIYTYECKTDVACTHDAGGMWSVWINVNEEDEKYSYTLPTNPASLFASENARDYDEGYQPTQPSNWVAVELSDDGYL